KPGTVAGEPDILKNYSTTTQDIGQGGPELGPGAFLLHPGLNGEYCVLRWTAPADGSYQIDAEFQGSDLTGATTDVHVLRNGTALLDGSINGGLGPGSGPTYAGTLSLRAGDIIDFAVGYGSNRNYFHDSTGLSVNIQYEKALYRYDVKA